jgi:hypothetical protein
LLGKKIEMKGEQSEMEALALELAKLNELLVVYGNKASDLKKKIGILIAVILLVLFACAIFGTWTDIWHEFGQNLYHLLND